MVSWTVLCFSFQQLVVQTFVFVTLLCAAVERASCEVHKLLRTGVVPTNLTAIVLVVADGLFGPCGLERLGQAIHRYLILPFPPSLIDCMQSLRMLQFIRGKTHTEWKGWQNNKRQGDGDHTSVKELVYLPICWGTQVPLWCKKNSSKWNS